MASDPRTVEHALELVAPLGEVTARAMFGGHGLYAEGAMFGLLWEDELFLKTDDLTRARFADAGCRQWVYVNRKVRMENTGFFRPPDDAHEAPDAMLPWARLALEAALRARAAKSARRPRRSKRSSAPKRSRTAKAPKTSKGARRRRTR